MNSNKDSSLDFDKLYKNKLHDTSLDVNNTSLDKNNVLIRHLLDLHKDVKSLLPKLKIKNKLHDTSLVENNTSLDKNIVLTRQLLDINKVLQKLKNIIIQYP